LAASPVWEEWASSTITGYRRVGQRVAELEDAIAGRRDRLAILARDSATEAPTFAHVAPLLDRLPLLANTLYTAPSGQLRALFESLQLEVVYHPAQSAVDVAVTLHDYGGYPHPGTTPTHAEDCLVPPAGSHADGKRRDLRFHGAY
jgi:hypothetical protein